MARYQTQHPSSKNLQTIQYSSDTKILRVLYKSGYLYFFYGVQKYIYDQISNGSPRGGKIAWKLLPNYPYRQINRNNSIDLSQYGFSSDEILLIQQIMR